MAGMVSLTEVPLQLAQTLIKSVDLRRSHPLRSEIYQSISCLRPSGVNSISFSHSFISSGSTVNSEFQQSKNSSSSIIDKKACDESLLDSSDLYSSVSLFECCSYSQKANSISISSSFSSLCNISMRDYFLMLYFLSIFNFF